MTSKFIVRSFSTRGLSLTVQATKALESVLARENDISGSLDYILNEVKDRIAKGTVTTNTIDVDIIQNIIADLTSNEEDVAQEKYQIVDAFSTPKLQFDDKNKSFKMIQAPSYQLFGDVESRGNMFRERLLITQQRLLRSEMFTLKGLKSQRNQMKSSEICTIESLLGSTGKKILFGFLTQPEEGSWYLEDLTSMIKLDLSHADRHDLLYTEGSQVIVEGEVSLNQAVFSVQFIGFPPLEEREKTLISLGIPDIFGLEQRQQHYLALRDLERESEEDIIVMLSEIHLDKPLVLEKLDQLFAGFEENGMTPLYILMGSFFTKSYFEILHGKQVMKEAFEQLALILAKYPLQCDQAKFLLIPGPLDAGINTILPRKPLPAELLSPLQSVLKHVKSSTNPCRVRCFTQEIVLCRQDLLKKMQRHLVLPVRTIENASTTTREGQQKEEEVIPDITEQLAETILDQGHLCPLPLHAQPIIWELDYVMRLCPLPHLLVLADKTEQYSYGYQSCNVLNPGTFSSDFSFIVYQPATQSIQFSRVPDK